MRPILRRAAIFGVAFFVVNVALNIYRDGGLTTPAIASAVVSTIIFTILFTLATLLINRLRDRGG